MKCGLFMIVAALIWPSYASAYGWPIRPFDEPHPIQGNFDDPRMSTQWIDSSNPKNQKSFHSGIDITAPAGTPVHAIYGGRVRLINGTAVSIRTSLQLMFGYWHITPVVQNGEEVEQHQLIGWIRPRPGGVGVEHVHLSEWRNGDYVNPRRFGGISPDPDDTPPVVKSLYLRSSGNGLFLNSLLRETDGSDIILVSGTIDLWVDIYDEPISQPEPPWDHIRLSPTVVSWWLKTPEEEMVIFPMVATDFRKFWRTPLEEIYAPGTRQNGKHQSGKYNIWLSQFLDTGLIPNGLYILVVRAEDAKGNFVKVGYPIRIENLVS